MSSASMEILSKPDKFKLWNSDISNEISPFFFQITVLGNKLINGLRTSPVPAGTDWVVAPVISQALANTFFFPRAQHNQTVGCQLGSRNVNSKAANIFHLGFSFVMLKNEVKNHHGNEYKAGKSAGTSKVLGSQN